LAALPRHPRSIRVHLRHLLLICGIMAQTPNALDRSGQPAAPPICTVLAPRPGTNLRRRGE